MQIIKGTALSEEHRNPQSEWIGWFYSELGFIPPNRVQWTHYHTCKKTNKNYTFYPQML